jgi:hypothetical protein
MSFSRRGMLVGVSALTLLTLLGGMARAKNLAATGTHREGGAKRFTLGPGPVQDNLQHTRPLIDGSKNPELIPDETAYMFFLRAITPNQNDPKGRRIRAYLRYVGVISGVEPMSEDERRVVDTLTRHSHEFAARAAAFNAGPSSARTAAAAEARKEGRRALVMRTVDQLKTELPVETSEQIHAFITQRMKRRITIVQ